MEEMVKVMDGISDAYKCGHADGVEEVRDWLKFVGELSPEADRALCSKFGIVDE